MPCQIIAEIAQNHDGSLGMAHSFIDAVAAAGATAIKFQVHIAEAESTRDEPWRVKFSFQDKTRYDYWKRMEFTEEQWSGLKHHCDNRNLKMICSPFSVEAVEMIGRVGVGAFKIASGELGSDPIFHKIAQLRLPVIVSTGMSPWREIDHAVHYIQEAGLDLTLMQCTSMYPTPPEKVGLNLIDQYRKRYRCKVGLSDHSGSIYAGLAAVALGAEAVEVHVAFSREMFGPDVPVSLTTSELRMLVDGTRAIEQMMLHPLDKDKVALDLAPMRNLFMKSVVAREPIGAGTVLTPELLTLKKPGTGIPATKMHQLIGKTLKRDIPADHLLREDDLA